MKIRQGIYNEILIWVGKVIIVNWKVIFSIISLGWRNREWFREVIFGQNLMDNLIRSRAEERRHLSVHLTCCILKFLLSSI